MAVDIYAGGKVIRQNIVLDRQKQSFNLSADVAPDLINVDAEKYLLAVKTEDKSLQQYAFQYKNAPLFMDRLEAIIELRAQKNEALARQVLMQALTDSNYVLRQLSVEFSAELQSEEKAVVYDKIRQIALKDPVSSVRAAAVKALAKSFPEKNNSEVFEQTAKDKAPSVVNATREARK